MEMACGGAPSLSLPLPIFSARDGLVVHLRDGRGRYESRFYTLGVARSCLKYGWQDKARARMLVGFAAILLEFEVGDKSDGAVPLVSGVAALRMVRAT